MIGFFVAATSAKVSDAHTHYSWQLPSMVMVAAGSVHVTVREFFLRRSANFDDLDFEIQMLACEWMIAVHSHRVTLDLRNRNGAIAIIGMSLKLHADFKRGGGAESGTWHLLNQGIILLTVPVGGCDADFQFIARFLALQLALEARDQVAVTLQENECIAAGGTIDHFARVVG